jgi:multiple sugar transport system permease protein
MDRDRLRQKITPYVLVFPTLFLLTLVSVYPLITTVFISFWNWPYLDPEAVRFVGLSNYIQLFAEDENFRSSLVFTLKFVVVNVGLSFVIGLLTALILDRIIVFVGGFKTIMILPYMIAPIAVAQMWRLIWMRDFGIVNYLLGLVGIESLNWLAEPSLAFWALVIAELWRSMPFVTLILLAGLKSIPPEIVEAARVDGVSGWKLFQHITFPMLLPSITIALVFQTIFKLRIFDIVYALTGGGPGYSTTPLGLMIQRRYFRSFRGGYASAISVVLLIIGVIFALVYIKLFYREENG